MRNDENTNMLSVTMDDIAVLHTAYMPFVAGGGIFIPTTPRHELGDEVFVLLGLPGDPNRIPVAGRVVWITPEGARGGKVPGIGVRFDDRDDLVRRRIDEMLTAADLELGERETYTL